MPFKDLLRRFRPRVPVPFDAPLQPDAPFYAIGDIHGEYEALDRLFDRLDAQGEECPVVCVGDYVDRGTRTADVLSRLHYIARDYSDFFICLRGNHEDMMLQFLDDPEGPGQRWLRHGGLQTLESFRVPFFAEDPARVRDALMDRLDPALLAWLRGLPALWRSGNVAVTHAGADPAVPLEAQPVDNFVWGHPDFDRRPRSDGVWVVHGHVVVDAPMMVQGRIAIDTGAYATGRLTAARIGSEGVSFFDSTGRMTG